MRTKRLVLIIVCVAFVLALAGPGFAQTTAGEVKGSVKDPSEAVVPGATVTLLNTETQISRRSQSNEAGLYSFPNVAPGNYELVAEKEGFKSWRGRLVLQVQQVAVIDALLAMGSVATTIEVKDVTPVIAAESSSISTVTTAAAIRELPLNGRDVTQLFQLTPGVQATDAPRVNGMKAGGAEMLQDGGSIVDRMSGGLPRITPGLDTVQEFNIDMNSTAQFSRPATVTMVTRSGTNQLHGAVFETFRNNAAGLKARSRSDGNTAAPYKRNEFGSSAGGPIRLPKLYNGTDKSFWFFSYEGRRLRQQSTAATYVPTQAMWDGDFSNLIDAQGNHYNIYDPRTTAADGTRLPFPGNIIPASVPRSQLYTYLMDHTPRPTNSTSPYAGTNWLGTASQPNDMNTFTGKLDHRISDRDTISGRFTIANNKSSSYLGYGPVPTDMSYNYQGDVVHLYSGTINYTRAFSPTVVNELLMSGQRSGSMMGGGREDVKWDTLLGLENPLAETGWPTLTAGNGPGNTFYWDSQNKNPEFLNTLIPEDNLTILHGKHEIKMGFRFRNERNNTRGVQMGQGRYGFSSGWTGLYDLADNKRVPYSGDGLASMLLGYGNFYKVQYNRPYYYLRQTELGSYVQDAWRVTPRLTLNYGLRWDFWTPYYESAHRMYNMDMSQWQTTHQLITPAGHPSDTLGIPPSLLQSFASAGMTYTTADKAGLPAQLQNSDKRDFAPRFGLAYMLDSKTVLRGGYGVYYWTVPLSQMLSEKLYSAPLNLAYIAETDYWNQIDDYDWFHQPVPGEKIGDPNIVDLNNPQSVQAPFGFTPYAKDWRNSRAQEWNFTIEREIMPATRLRLSYIGNHGSQLEQTETLNSQQSHYLYVTQTGQPLPQNLETLRVNPFWQNLNLRTPIGYSNSNSLQVSVERRAYKDLEFQWYWVFSRNLSTTDSNGYASQPGALVPDPVVLPNPGTLSDRLKLVYSNVSAVPKHQIGWHAMYDLPFGRGKAFGRNMSRAVDQVLGGWQLRSMGSFRTGTWLTPGDPNNSWAWWNNYVLNSDPRLSASQRQVINFAGRPQMLYFRGNFDSTGTGLQNYQPAFAKPGDNGYVPVQLKDGTPYQVFYDVYNSMPSNFIEGPKNWNIDMSVWKNFKITESASLRFTADCFNVLNHPNNLDPDKITGLIDLSQQSNAPRIMQFSLRVQF